MSALVGTAALPEAAGLTEAARAAVDDVPGAWTSAVDRGAVWAALEGVEDPELPVSVTDLGLVRLLEADGGRVRIGMTWTSLACPCTDVIREEVADAVADVPGVTGVEVHDRLEAWSRDDLSPAGVEALRAVAVI